MNMNTDSSNSNSNTSAIQSSAKFDTKSLSKRIYSFSLGTCGVFFPVFSIILDLLTGHALSSSVLMLNPIPSLLHLLLLAAIPYTTLSVLRYHRMNDAESIKPLPILLGVNLITCFVYSLLFLQYLTLGITISFYLSITLIGILAMPFVMLLFTPYLALYSTIVSIRLYFKDDSQLLNRKRLIYGCSLGCLLIILAEFKSTTTRLASDALISNSQNHLAIKFLRLMGDQDYLLRRSYGEQVFHPDFLSVIQSYRNVNFFDFHFTRNTTLDIGNSPEKRKAYRSIFYKVSGKPFNSFKKPSSVFSSGGIFSFFGDDKDLGAEQVGGIAENLSLQSSIINGNIDTLHDISYLEMEVVFKNLSTFQREARFELSIPPGSSVNRATLWVNGEEREAAIGGREKARQAYSSVVSYRKDPLLVSYSGKDRILVQCFPVPANGEMKIRLGLASPLVPLEENSRRFTLPYLTERNFEIREHFTHSVWIDTKGEIIEEGSEEQQGKQVWQRNLKAEELDLQTISLLVRSTNESPARMVKNPYSAEGELLERKVTISQPVEIDNLFIVIDASATVGQNVTQIESLLKTIPAGKVKSVILASDRVETVFDSVVDNTSVDTLNIIDRIKQIGFEGGVDAAPALTLAWMKAYELPKSAVFWIHGPQAILTSETEQLLQKYQRARNSNPIFAYSIAHGPQSLVNELNENNLLINLNNFLPAKPEDSEIVSVLLDSNIRKRISWSPASISAEGLESPPENSFVAQLWAASEIERIKSNHKEKAILLGSSYRIVSPVTSAIVLERDEQYQQFGLNAPVQSKNPGFNVPWLIPTAPEAETWMMIIIAFIGLGIAMRQYRLQLVRW